MIYLLLVLAVISQNDISITDTNGSPVSGASICSDSTLIGISDALGEVSVPEGTGTVEIRAIGYETWDGIIPPSGKIFLNPVPVPSGVVISVTGSRSGFKDQFPVTTVLAADDMERIGRSGLRSLCSRSSGIYVREYGGAMPVISISIRGSDAAQSEYYIDGHEISSSFDGLPGMTVDPSLFGGMEISRGGGSGFLRGGMAGTLNFLSEAPHLPPRASICAGDDNSLSLSGGFSAGSSRVSIGIRKLTGISGTTAHNGSLLIHGINSSFSYGILTAVSSGQTENPDWTLPTDGKRKRISFDGWAGWNHGGLNLSAGMRTGRHEYTSTKPEYVDDTHDELSGDISAEYRLSALPFHFSLSAGSSFDRIWSTALGDRDRFTGETALSCGYGDRMSFSASVSLNAVNSERLMHGAVISAGLPVLDSLLLLHTSASRGFRRPALNDLYWPEDNFARGNPDLMPETSLEFEAGISLIGLDNIRLSATGFIAETENLIRWEPVEDGKWSPVNIAGAFRKGIEAEAWFTSEPFEVTGTLTFLQVTDNCSESVNFGRILPYTPDYTYGIQLGVDFPRWAHWTFSTSGMGVRFKNYSETSWMPAYKLYAAGLDLHPEFLGNFSLNLSTDNLLDEDYQETSGYSGKPRTVYIGIKWNGN